MKEKSSSIFKEYIKDNDREGFKEMKKERKELKKIIKTGIFKNV